MTTEWIDAIPIADLALSTPPGSTAKRSAITSSARSCAMRCATASSMPTCIRAICSSSRTARWSPVDFGIMGRLGPKEKRFLAEILYGFLMRDYRRTAQMHLDAGYVPAHFSVEAFAQALRSIGEPLMDRTAEEISMARLLSQLFEVTELFDMQTRPELLLLQKTMVVVEGVARSLDPKLNIWTAAEPVVKAWMEEQIGPRARLNEAAEGFSALAGLVAEAPKLAEQARRMSAALARTGENGLHLDNSTVDRMAAAQSAKRWPDAGRAMGRRDRDDGDRDQALDLTRRSVG